MNQVGLIGGAIAALTIGLIFDAIYFRLTHSHPASLLRILTSVIVPAFLFLLILIFAGAGRRDLLRSTFRLPLPEYFVIAFLLPVTIYSIPQVLTEIRDPSHWIILSRGAPGLELFLLALAEEMAWRGYLQPRFISRFGLYRGIIFVGLVWAAFHFSGDFAGNQTDAGVMRSLAGRIVGAIVIGFALSWLTLRSKSVLPAAVAHTTINSISSFGGASYWLALSLWAVVDLLLFRFWPPRALAFDAPKSRVREANAAL